MNDSCCILLQTAATYGERRGALRSSTSRGMNQFPVPPQSAVLPWRRCSWISVLERSFRFRTDHGTPSNRPLSKSRWPQKRVVHRAADDDSNHTPETGKPARRRCHTFAPEFRTVHELRQCMCIITAFLMTARYFAVSANPFYVPRTTETVRFPSTVLLCGTVCQLTCAHQTYQSNFPESAKDVSLPNYLLTAHLLFQATLARYKWHDGDDDYHHYYYLILESLTC